MYEAGTDQIQGNKCEVGNVVVCVLCGDDEEPGAQLNVKWPAVEGGPVAGEEEDEFF